jgi:uncharacterized membrane protein YcjF (UPF0283 family)
MAARGCVGRKGADVIISVSIVPLPRQRPGLVAIYTMIWRLRRRAGVQRARLKGDFWRASRGISIMREIGRDTVGFLGQMYGQISWEDIGYAIAGFVVLLFALAVVKIIIDEWRLWRLRRRLPD